MWNAYSSIGLQFQRWYARCAERTPKALTRGGSSFPRRSEPAAAGQMACCMRLSLATVSHCQHAPPFPPSLPLRLPGNRCVLIWVRGAPRSLSLALQRVR